MKFKIKKGKEEKPEKEIELWLEKEHGVVNLKGRNTGDKLSYYIMSFEDGKFTRTERADIKGLEVDIDGRIKEG